MLSFTSRLAETCSHGYSNCQPRPFFLWAWETIMWIRASMEVKERLTMQLSSSFSVPTFVLASQNFTCFLAAHRLGVLIRY